MRMIFNAHFSSFEQHKPLKTCVWLSASSLKAFWSISCASVAILLRWKQNLKQIRCLVRSDITISWEELDTTWENWQHKPVQPSMATPTWLLTREGCNYTHLVGNTRLRLRRALQSQSGFFGSPLIFISGLIPCFVCSQDNRGVSKCRETRIQKKYIVSAFYPKWVPYQLLHCVIKHSLCVCSHKKSTLVHVFLFDYLKLRI